MTTDLLPRLQALLAIRDKQAPSAARKVEKFREPTPGAFYAGAMFGYEDCADGLTMLLKEVLAASVERL